MVLYKILNQDLNITSCVWWCDAAIVR